MWQNLRAWRLFREKTLEGISAILGVSHSTLLRYERGNMKPPAAVLSQLAKIYECTLTELQLPPDQRDRGLRIHAAMGLAASLDPEAAEKWLEIGRLLNGAIRPEGDPVKTDEPSKK
jgi:transcriptional regulator with XRE-family HTH domain